MTIPFWQVLRNTLLIGGGILVFGFLPPIIVALALNEVAQHHVQEGRPNSRLPAPPVLVGGYRRHVDLPALPFRRPRQRDAGTVDVGPIRFLTNTSWARLMMIVLPIWKDMGYAAIIYLASITSINPSLYEAARIDGASRFQQTYQITLPMLKPTMKVVFMLNILGLLRIFDQIFVMRNAVVENEGGCADDLRL